MEEDVKGLADYLEVLHRRKFWLIIPTLVLIVLSGVITYLLPATYKSEGLILIESQEIPVDLVRSTVTSYADQRIEVIKQRIMTTAKIMDMVNKYDLYTELRKKEPVSEIVAAFRENIDVEMVEANVTDPRSGRARHATIAFKVSFMDESPRLAQKVANELVTEFLVENSKARTSRANQTTVFLEEEANKFQQKVQEVAKKIADFKEENKNSLPELLQHNLARAERLKLELGYNKNQILQLKDLTTTMSLELPNIEPYKEAESTNTQANKPRSAKQNLETADANYKLLTSRYSANHPDVKALLNHIVELRAQVKLEEEQINAVSEAEPTFTSKKSGRVRNPLYIQIKARIDSSEREVTRLEKRNVEIEQEITVYEERIVRTHRVERAYDELRRDHANKLRKYEELRAKQLEAELGQNLESENKGETFTLIEPPLVPTKAEKPDRVKLFVLGSIGSVVIGIGTALLIEILFGGVRGYNGITRVLGTAPLIVVPVIITQQDIKQKQIKNKRRFILIIVGLGLAIIGTHFWIVNLEVQWFKVLRKISLL